MEGDDPVIHSPMPWSAQWVTTHYLHHVSTSKPLNLVRALHALPPKFLLVQGFKWSHDAARGAAFFSGLPLACLGAC